MNQEKKEALLYEKLEDSKVKCLLCPHFCTIRPGNVGFCGVRQNVDGVLYTLIYGKVSSVAVDPIEKKPLYHFYPGSKVLSLGTYGCNMRCGYCQNWQISHQVMVKGVEEGKSYTLFEPPQTEYISPEKVIEMAKENDCRGVAWTYNEPTIWFEYTLDCAKLAKENDLYTVYVTNGYITPEALDMIGPYLDAFRVDIKGFNNEFYRKLCRIPDFFPVLEATVRAKKKWNMHVEAVTLVIPTMNDDPKELKKIATWIVNELGPNTPWHVTRFMPYLDYSDLPPTPVDTLDRAREIGMEAGLNYVYVGNVAGNPGENTYCPKCQKVLIKRLGYRVSKPSIIDGKCEFCGENLLGIIY